MMELGRGCKILFRFQLEVFGLEHAIGLANDVVPLLCFSQEIFQILDSLILPFPVCSLGSTILCSTTL